MFLAKAIYLPGVPGWIIPGCLQCWVALGRCFSLFSDSLCVSDSLLNVCSIDKLSLASLLGVELSSIFSFCMPLQCN